jgi:RHH-type proline utilization regulon transcriptional repressor/proline dehydrogenase/delta 1-pyrroline-5-carboxylate dehydrogenase
LLERCCRVIGDAWTQELLRASAESYAWAWQAHYSQAHDPSQLLGEVNLLRYQPVQGMLMRVDAETDAVHLAQALLAAVTCAAPLTVSLSADQRSWRWLAELDTVQGVVEDEAELRARLNAGNLVYDRLRALGPLSTALRRAIHAADISVVDAPVVANGRLELRYYLREQSISQTVHRYGTILDQIA